MTEKTEAQIAAEKKAAEEAAKAKVEQDAIDLQLMKEGIAEMDDVYSKMVESLLSDKMGKAKSYAALLKAQMKEDFGL